MDFQWFSHAPGTARQHLQELRQKSGAPGWTTHWKSMGKSSNYSWGDMKYVLCLLCLITGGYIRGVWWGLYEIDSANVNDFHVFFPIFGDGLHGWSLRTPAYWQGPLDHVPWGDGIFFNRHGRKRCFVERYIYICQYHFINMIFTKKIVT